MTTDLKTGAGVILPLPFPAGMEKGTGYMRTLILEKRRRKMSRGIITQENYQTLKKESTDRKSQRLSMYEKRIHALARRKGRREKK